uniref:Protein kinase domain-containing protein n=1 Tax=Clytia hemisphaerica TaxID=252671 RepID=A0A7M5UV29_9CNID
MSMEILYFIALGKESRVRGCLNGGVHVDAGNHRNERPLFFAAKHGNESILKMLLKTGADPNLQNDGGLTALMAASDHGHNECVKDLLRWGALWRLKELKGLTPLSRITRLRNIAFKDTTPIQTSDIKADPSKSARSVDVFHIFSLKDCIVYNTKYLAKIQLRPSYNNNRVSKKEDDDFLEKEYRMLRSLVHPHIIMSHFISISSERKFNILITEPMSYGNLYHVLYDKKKSLQTKLVKMATDGILKALVYLTTKSIIHNFINSSSVYFTRGWVAKLGNFEHALLDGENPKRAMSSASEKYHFPYMAPELHLYDDSLPSSASDVYSFGCLVWEMYGLRRPWSWLERTEIVCLAQVKHPITLPMSTCWPESIKTIIEIATKQRPFQRPTFRTLYSDVFRPLIESENGAILKSCNADDSSQIEFEKLEGSYISESGRRRHGVIDPTSRSVAMLQRANPSGIKTHCQSHCLCASHQANVPAIRVLDSATFSSEHVVNIVNVDSVEETTTFQEAAFQRKSTIKPKRNQSAARKEIFSVDPKPIAQRTSIKPPARDQLFTPESHISSKSKEMMALEPDLNSKRKSINTNRQDEPIKSSTRKSIRPVVHDETFELDARQTRKSIMPALNEEIFEPEARQTPQRRSIRPLAHEETFEQDAARQTPTRKSIRPPTHDETFEPEARQTPQRRSIRPLAHEETFEQDTARLTPTRKSIRPPTHDETFEPEARQTPQRRSIRPLAHEETFEPDTDRQTPTRNSIRPPVHDESFEPEARQTSHRRSIRPPTHVETFEPDTDRLTPNRRSIRPHTHEETFEPDTARQTPTRNSIRPPVHDESFEPEARQTSHRRSIRPPTHVETFEPDTDRLTPNRKSIRPSIHAESFEPEARQTPQRRSIRPPTHEETFELDTARQTPTRNSIRPPVHDESFEPEARQTSHRRSIRPPTHEETFELDTDRLTPNRKSIRPSIHAESFEPEVRQTSHRRSIRPPTHDETFEPEGRQTPQRRLIRPPAHEEAFEPDAARQTPNRKPTRPPTHDETFEPEVRQTPQRRSIRPPAHEETLVSNAKQEPHRKSIRPPTHEETFEQEAVQTPHRKSARPPAQEETFEPERIIMDKRRSIRPSAHEETLDEPKHRQRQASIKPQVHEETFAPNPYHKQHRNSIKPPTHDGNINPEPRIVEQRATTVAEYDPPRQPQESIYSQHEFESNKKQHDHNEKHFSPKADNRHQMNHHHYPEEPIDSRQQYNENYPMNNTRVYTENSKQVKSSETSRQDYREPNDNYTDKNYDINTTHTQRNTHPDKHQRSEVIQENLYRQAQNNTKHVTNEAHRMNNLSTRGYSEKSNQKQSVKHSGQTPEVIYNEITEENVQSGQKHQPKAAYKLPPRQLDIVQYIENLHKSDLSTKANKESLYQTREDIYQKREDIYQKRESPYQKRDSVNQDKQITGFSKNIHKDSNTEEKTNVKNNINQKQLILNTKPSDGQEQVTGTGGKSKDNKNNSTKPKQNNKNNKDSKKSKFPFKAFSRRRKSESSESDEVYDEPYEIVDGRRPITIYNNFTIQNQPDIVEKVQTTGFLNTPTPKEIRKISSPVSKENQELFSSTTKETNVPTSLLSKETPIPTTLVSKETHVPTTLVSRETDDHHIPTTKEIHCTFSDLGINHYEEVNTDPSNFLRIKKQNNKTVQYPSPLAEWSPASSIDVFREDFVSKGSFVKDFLGKMKNDAPSSFEKIENKLGSFFEKEDSVYELVSNPVVMSDKMEKDAQVQEIFQMAGNHERKNWAKLETTNRGRRNTKRMYCGDHLIEFGNDNSVSVRGGRSLMRKR